MTGIDAHAWVLAVQEVGRGGQGVVNLACEARCRARLPRRGGVRDACFSMACEAQTAATTKLLSAAMSSHGDAAHVRYAALWSARLYV